MLELVQTSCVEVVEEIRGLCKSIWYSLFKYIQIGFIFEELFLHAGKNFCRAPPVKSVFGNCL